MDLSDRDSKYKIAISLLPGIGSILARRIIEHTGSAEGIFHEKRPTLEKIPGIGTKLARVARQPGILEKAEKELEFMRKYRIRGYFYLDEDYPFRLKNCADGPVVLYVKGNSGPDHPRMISIVGTRSATTYGLTVCQQFIRELAERGHRLVVVSGLAYGIDVCAHRSALKNGFPTLAVMGHGLSTVYPSQHLQVARKIARQGALVTDFPGDARPERNNFIKRNRIIAGLTDATIIIESALKGGALITADIAGSYNRDVFCFPGRTHDAYSSGCNWLIKTNRASLIENASDLEYMMGWDAGPDDRKNLQKALLPELEEEEKKLLDILGKGDDMNMDTICRQTGLPVNKISSLLLNLEFKGLISSLPGNIYRICIR